MAPNRRADRGSGRGHRDLPPEPTRKADIVLAIDAVRAAVADREVFPLIAGREAEAIAGLVVLACRLGERIVGPDRLDLFALMLLDLQAHERLAELFDTEAA